MLAHGEIIVRTPDGDRLWSVMPGKTTRVGEFALIAQDIDEDTVAPLGVQPVDSFVEYLVVIHVSYTPHALRICG